mgnify:CR=1 FL=1
MLSFEFDCKLSGKDHAGIRLKINIGSLELTISFYDSRHWDYKKKMSSNISNSNFDDIYNLAKENGAIGGKISGAGGGGFFTFYCEENQESKPFCPIRNWLYLSGCGSEWIV